MHKKNVSKLLKKRWGSHISLVDFIFFFFSVQTLLNMSGNSADLNRK